MMEEIESLNLSIDKRVLFEQFNDIGPLLVFVCGIHGNEPMSVLAMQEISKTILEDNIHLKGSVLAITGNIEALNKGERYIESDLNRMWSENTIDAISNGSLFQNERAEMKEIWDLLKERIENNTKREVIIFDLHTTSSPSVPFITINDTISNRKISSKYPLATVFGIEEYLDGPLLSYMNELGINAIGFEGGQHLDKNSFENHQAFIWLTLANQGLISAEGEKVKLAFNRLNKLSLDPHKFFEITYREEVLEHDDFQMYNGYSNFQSIKKESKLARRNGFEIISEWNDYIFMPLYQDKGDDGFFIIRRIPVFYLWLSKILRKYNFEKLLLLLPGVTMYNKKKHVLAVNNRVTKLMRNKIFHLFGFRQKKHFSSTITLYIRREKQ